LLELAILKLFCKDKSNWDKYNKLIKGLNLEKELALIFNLVSAYYEEYPEHSYIVPQELKAFFSLEYASYKSPEIINKVIDDIFLVEISDSVIVDYVQSVIEKDTATKIINKLLKVVDESEQGLLLTVEEDLQQFKDTLHLHASNDVEEFIDMDLDKLLEEECVANGIDWRLNCLQEDVGPLRGGNLIHIFARPETGKTSFLSSEITHFLKQLKDSETIIWFNNEQKGSKVALRLYSAMLGVSLPEILSNRTLAKEEFIRRGGDRIKLYDNAFISIEDINTVCLKHKPRILVIDQGDKVTFKGAQNQDGPIRLKNLYIKFRELAKFHNIDIITVGQASAEAHGKKWLEMVHMDFSKTGKPGELDLALGIGVAMEEGKEHMRFINISKNKLSGVHSRRAVILDTTTGRYSNG
jgi:replicative DNA helicase